MHDDARFVLLLRDTVSWLDSRIEFALRKAPTSVGDESMRARYGRYGESFRPGEAALETAGLYPIAAYFRYWTELAEKVMRDVPMDRLCVVRTEDLDVSNERLATFAGVDPSTILTVHANHNEQRTGILRTVPEQLVVELAQEHCAPLMQRYWGDDWVDLTDRVTYR